MSQQATSTSSNHSKYRWYYKTWAIVLSFFIFFPIGFLLIWKHPLWQRRKKKFATAFACAALIMFIILAVIFAPPSINVTSALSPVKGSDYTLNGKVDPPNSVVTVNGKKVSVKGGIFTARVGLNEGDNNIDIVVVNDGKQSKKTIIIHRYTRSEVAKLFPTITTQDVAEIKSIPFSSTSTQSSALVKGTSKITTIGSNGSEILTYRITYSNGKQINKKLINTNITVQPVTQITTVGTYVAPTPASSYGSSYTNVDGNRVESPDSNSSGATGVCNDGTYTHALHHQGACSYHGGVAYWL